MKIRSGYVSNSSSSSFIVAAKPSSVPALKLPKEYVDRLRKHAVDWDGKPLVLPPGDELWLTAFVSDCRDGDWDELKQGCAYMEGELAEEPRELADGDWRKSLVRLKSGYDEFYLRISDLTGGVDALPDGLRLREAVRDVLASKKMKQSEKLAAIASLVSDGEDE